IERVDELERALDLLVPRLIHAAVRGDDLLCGRRQGERHAAILFTSMLAPMMPLATAADTEKRNVRPPPPRLDWPRRVVLIRLIVSPAMPSFRSRGGVNVIPSSDQEIM